MVILTLLAYGIYKENMKKEVSLNKSTIQDDPKVEETFSNSSPSPSPKKESSKIDNSKKESPSRLQHSHYEDRRRTQSHKVSLRESVKKKIF